MSSPLLSATFTVGDYNVGGAQSLTASVAPGWNITGNLLYFPNVSGGDATVTIQYWQNGTAAGQPVTWTITSQLPASDSLTVPADVDQMVLTFGKVAFPAGNVTIGVSK
ncbi:hypothetical protein ACG3SL_10250 [Sphingomonas sp. CJ20]